MPETPDLGIPRKKNIAGFWKKCEPVDDMVCIENILVVTVL